MSKRGKYAYIPLEVLREMRKIELELGIKSKSEQLRVLIKRKQKDEMYKL